MAWRHARGFLLLVIIGLLSVMLVLCIVASIPLGLGLLAWIPLSFTSTYAAYRDIFTEDTGAATEVANA